MKRIILIVALLGAAVGAQAQMMFQRSIELPSLPSKPDSAAVADSLWWAEQPRLKLELGLSAGYSLFLQDENPYCSTHGYTLQIPLLLQYYMTPHWRLSTGLRYDFNWDPLKYRVTYGYDDSHPLTIDTGLFRGRQSAYAFHSYLGVPLQLTWYPMPKDRGLLSVSFDLYAAYSVSRFLMVKEADDRYYDPYTLGVGGSMSEDEHGDPSMLPWKLEVGLSLNTSVLGLIHGVRFYADLLPLYREPVSGEKIRNVGMTIFL